MIPLDTICTTVWRLAELFSVVYLLTYFPREDRKQ